MVGPRPWAETTDHSCQKNSHMFVDMQTLLWICLLIILLLFGAQPHQPVQSATVLQQVITTTAFKVLTFVSCLRAPLWPARAFVEAGVANVCVKERD